MKCYALIAVLALSFCPGPYAAAAAESPIKRAEAEALIAQLNFQKGTIALDKNLATVSVPADMRFLNGHDAGVVLAKIWNNPPQDDPLGMLVPADCDLLIDCWAVIISYEEEGYVKDDDAEKIDYDKLLQRMKKDIAGANKLRKKKGYPALELVGWGAPPRYDRDTHKLYWAKEIKFEDSPENTLNYNIRMLGRRGVLVLNAVASMEQLPEIEQSTPKLLSAVDFNPGNRYTDFSAASGDKVATYGIAALVAGGIAAKAGLFKGLWLALLGAKKLIIVAVVAAAGGLRKLFGRDRVET